MPGKLVAGWRRRANHLVASDAELADAVERTVVGDEGLAGRNAFLQVRQDRQSAGRRELLLVQEAVFLACQRRHHALIRADELSSRLQRAVTRQQPADAIELPVALAAKQVHVGLRRPARLVGGLRAQKHGGVDEGVAQVAAEHLAAAQQQVEVLALPALVGDRQARSNDDPVHQARQRKAFEIRAQHGVEIVDALTRRQSQQPGAFGNVAGMQLQDAEREVAV